MNKLLLRGQMGQGNVIEYYINFLGLLKQISINAMA